MIYRLSTASGIAEGESTPHLLASLSPVHRSCRVQGAVCLPLQNNKGRDLRKGKT